MPFEKSAVYIWGREKNQKSPKSRKKIGVADSPLSVPILPPLQPVVNTEFQLVPRFRDKGFLQTKYVEDGLSIAEVARLCFSSRCAVRNGLKRHGIPIKAQDNLLKSKQQLRYGEAKRNRQIIGDRREQEAIMKMQQLRTQGFSYWKIADILNTMRIPTKTHRGKWHARSVQKSMKI